MQRSEAGQPFYCVVIEGASRLAVDGREPIELQAGDFVLIPAAYGFTMSSMELQSSADVDPLTVTQLQGEVRHGDPNGVPNARLLVGHFTFNSPDAVLLVSLLPQLLHVRGEKRLATIVKLVADEARAQRPAREMILSHLMQILLVEALRTTPQAEAPHGLLRGLADNRLAAAIRQMHGNPTRDWTIGELAQEAALSRSAFFDRFRRAVGVAPMEYLLSWRMALAKSLLRSNACGVKEIAERVGYGSASAFTVAFTRFVGLPPTHYARKNM